MPRRPRIEYPGAFYHVMCMGNKGEYLEINSQFTIRNLQFLKCKEERSNYEG